MSAPTTNIPVAVPAGAASSTSGGQSGQPRTIAGSLPSARTLASRLLHGTPGRMRLFGLLGVLAAVVLGASRTLEQAIYPYTVFLQTVPIVAIAPILVLWFGPGLRAVAVSAFIVSVFPVIANTLSGMRSVDPRLRDLFRLYGAKKLDTVFKLELPFALPSIATGLRVASGLSVIGAIVGEFVASQQGLGYVIITTQGSMNTPVAFAALVWISLVGLAVYGLVVLAARCIAPWADSVD